MRPIAFEEIEFQLVVHQPQVERFRAKINRTHFPTHTHDGFVVGLVHSGIQRFVHRGTSFDAGAGSIILINPDELHSAEAFRGEEVQYQTLHVPESAMLEVAPEGFRFVEPVIFAPEICAKIAENLRVLDATNESPDWHERLSAILFEVGSLKSDFQVGNNAIDDFRLRSILQYIEANLPEALRVETLAEISNLSKFHFIRFFKDKVGVTPHAYIQARRTAFAKRLLESNSPAIAASMAGFVDQSHLNKWLKACYGTTPSVISKKFSKNDQCRV